MMNQWTPEGLMEYAPEQEQTWLDRYLSRLYSPTSQALLALGATLSKGNRKFEPITSGLFNAVQTFGKQKEHQLDEQWQGRQRAMVEEEYPIELEGKRLNNRAHQNANTRFGWDAEDRSREQGAFDTILPQAFEGLSEENPDLKPLIDYALQTHNSTLAASILQHKNERIPFEQGGKTYYLTPTQYKQLTHQGSSTNDLRLRALAGDEAAAQALRDEEAAKVRLKKTPSGRATSPTAVKHEEMYNPETDHTVLVPSTDVNLKKMYLDAGYETTKTKALKGKGKSTGTPTRKLEEIAGGKPPTGGTAPSTKPSTKQFKSLPPASQFKGRTMNGGTIVSDGKNWIDKRTGKIIQ